MKRLLLVLVTAAVLAPAPAQAQTLTNQVCPANPFVGLTVFSCSGWWNGNLLNRGAGQLTDADENTGLFAIGYGSQTVIQKIASVPVAVIPAPQYIDFTALLYGRTVIAMHWGNGVFNSVYGNGNYNGNGGGTAFYEIDAGTTGLDKIELSVIWRQSISNATLYRTGTAPEDPPSGGQEIVPEPATMTLLATGLAGMAAARRRRKSV